MSRFIQGDCVRVMATFPGNAVDFILTDPPYLVGFRDRQGRTIAGDKTDEWLQPACNEMYRVLKKDALMVSFYGWNRVDRFMAAWKNAGFSVVGHLVFTKTYTSKAAYVGYRHECAYILAKGRPALPQKPLPDVLGWKYSGNRHHPTEKPVIRNVLLPSFANAFTEAGFATITFDYRGFGESEGERGRLVPAMQTEDIISVINWAEKQVCIDNQRIGLWGTSLGGCHVFNAAAQDKRVKSIVSQLAFADGEVLVTGEMNELEKASFLSTLNKMAEKKKNTGKEMFVGVTRVLSDNESKVFFEKVKGQYPEMDIKIPFLTVMETLQYKPAESAAKVQCPVLVVIAGQDSVNPPEQGRALYDAVASGTKELYEEADACHYDIYKGAFFERVAAVQTQWFKKHL